MLPLYFDELVFPCCNEILPGAMMKPISVDIYGSKQIRNTENDLPSRPGLFLTDVPVGFQLGWVSLQVEGCNPESQNKIITR